MPTDTQVITDKPQRVPFWEAFSYWLKLGFISFGGPAGQISMMHQELVEKRRWISEHRFLHALNYTMVLPGPEAQQLATWRHDIKFTAPLTGITAAVVGVVLNLAVFFAYHVLWPDGFGETFEWFSALIGATAFVALFRYKAGIVPVIVACAMVGLAYSLLF